MTFPNSDWQEEQDTPRWRPVAGKANIFIHDDCPCCEVEIVKVDCPKCGGHIATHMHRVVCREGTVGHEPPVDRAAHEASVVLTHHCEPPPPSSPSETGDLTIGS